MRHLYLAAATMLALGFAGGEASAAAGTLTYVKDGNVFVSPDDGSATAQVTSDGTSSSPYLAASQSASGMIVAVRGGTAFRLSQGGQELAPPLSLPGGAFGGGGGVSPDGRTLAYVTADLCGIIPHACGSTRFLSLVTGAPLSGNGEGMQSPAWAGDAEVIGATGCYGVYRAAPGRGSVEPWISLLEPPWDSLNAPGCVSGAAASADGKRMVIASSSSTASTLILSIMSGLGEMPISKCRQDATGSGLEPHPIWSPNGGAIAWEEPDGIWTETIVDLSGSDEGCAANGDTQRLTIPGASRPSWSTAPFDPRRVDPPAPKAPPATDTTKPVGKITLAGSLRLRALLKGLKVKLTCSESATARAALKVDPKTAKALGLTGRKRAPATIATDSVQCVRGRRALVTLKPKRATARRLARIRRAWKATLSVALTDGAGNVGRTSKRLTVRR